ncbi:MAG TPA: T9SS type A sorting domain-containing protein [Flavobacteriaceae bacterium]|nr:RNA-binding protein [Flavobacteriaceae bacterium]HIB49219.1 T9SS type A sorting domain-containing protein [Flavobacteriaceae bacterium]HIO00203.1 T9SS type A sorting domain-containing protein [Flavobacteriaceae bacterium]|tara:strand:- start:111975 stop:113597 length:1623 start_codon:yes stop_codon:yes gene_type:complete
MKKILSLALVLVAPLALMAQESISFTNQNNLIGNYQSSSDVATDMNGDRLDDYVRVSSSGIGIDYQNPDGTFTSVFINKNIQNVPNWSVAAGDIDQNGYNDLVLGNGQRVSFLVANSDGTDYTEVTFPEFIFSQRSTFADIDNDGDLDAFVCHDVDLSHPYRNDGTGTMTLDQSLIQTIDAPGNYAAIWVDYDMDGDQDMYLTKCRGGEPTGHPLNENAMYTNNGDGTFTENALAIGLQDADRSWATVFEDFDNDGDWDAFVVNHATQNNFFENDGNGNFTNIIETTGINKNDLGSWENLAADFNNDGYMDILSEMQAEVYLGNGDLTFTGQSLPFDEGAIGDFNGDGFLDVARGGDLWINDGNSNNYLMIGLVGVESNLNGIGARITIEGDWGTQMKELRSGQGFQHMSSLNVHFGLGAATTVETITINWPNGTVDVFEDVDANQTVVYTQGESVVLGLTDVSATTVNIYPNPTASELNFSMAGMEGTAVSVVDVNGKLVMNTNISASNSIDVTRLQSGVYFVQFEIENEAQSIKFIKK